MRTLTRIVTALAVITAIHRLGRCSTVRSDSRLSEPEVFECIGCESTYTCRLSELRASRWTTHRLRDGTVVVLCDECRETYSERRRMREALSWT